MLQYLTLAVFAFTVATSLPLLGRLVRLSRNPTPKGLFVIPECQRPTGTSNTTEFDIIAVHGLGANPTHTWTAHLESPGPESTWFGIFHPAKRKRVAWLQAFLPSVFPASRIMMFAHNADWLYRAPFNTSHKSARFLLECIVKDREQKNKTRRPIIFIAHSYGGIIVKDALVLAKLYPEFSEISAATAGVIFLGTPHKGSNISAIGSLVARLASPVLGSSDMLIKSLGYHSSDLYDRHEIFLKSYLDHIKLCCYFEQIPTWVFGLPLGLVVDEVSATIDDARVPGKPVNRNHSALNKFADRGDTAFTDLCDTIRGMMKFGEESAYVRLSREQDEIKDIIAHCQKHQDAVQKDFEALSQFYNNSPSKSTTLPRVNWFLESKQYSTWTSTNNSGSSHARFLWYTGRPDSGKSAALTYVVDRLRSSSETIDLIYFFGSIPSVERSRTARSNVTAARVLESLITQLIHCDSVYSYGKRLSSLATDDRERLRSISKPALELSSKMLWDLFGRLLRYKMERRVLVIIDGLDAIQPEEDRNRFVRQLRDLWDSLALELSATSKFLVSSLPYDPIRQAFVNLPFIDPITEVTACLDSLKSLAANPRQESIVEAQANTGEWIIPTREYQSWNTENQSQTILVLGKAGSGKSTLISKLLKSKQEEHGVPDLKDLLDGPIRATRSVQKEESKGSQPADEDESQTAKVAHEKCKIIVASFFYSQKLASDTSHAHMLASLLFQILSQEERLVELYQEEYLRIRERQRMRQVGGENAFDTTKWEFAELEAIFLRVRTFSGFPLTIFIFLDGVDESEDSTDRYKLLELLTRFPSTEPPGTIIKTLIASRQLDRPFETATNCHNFLLEGENGPDIERAINAKLVPIQKAVARLDEEERGEYDIEAFRTTMIKNAKGVFLWVSLVLTFVERLFLDGLHSPDAITEALESPPDDLEKLYAAIIARLKLHDATRITKGKVWLEVVTVAVRFLDIKEFADAVAVSASPNITDKQLRGSRIPVSDMKAFQRALINICGGFLELKTMREVRTENPRLTIKVETWSAAETSVQLLHWTVKEFLRKEKAGPFQISLKNATMLITETCIQYLKLALSHKNIPKEVKLATESHGVVSWGPTEFEHYIRYLERRPFLHYTFVCLPVHLDTLGTAETGIISKLSDAISALSKEPKSPGRHILSHWIRHVRRLVIQTATSGGGAQQSSPSNLSRFWESQAERDELASRDRWHISSSFLARALETASRMGAFRTVKLLCAVGGSGDNLPDEILTAALEAAAKARHTQIVEFLSQERAPISSLDQIQKIDQANSEVQAPAEGQTNKISPVTGADVALLEAAERGDPKTVRMLLRKGAAADARNHLGRSPVHLSALAGSRAVVELLLDVGADRDTKDSSGLTPLALAALNGHEAVVQQLLTAGADPNSRDKSSRSPLLWATLNNHEAVIRQLLHFGADDKDLEIDRNFFMVPFSRDHRFVGRDVILDRLSRAFFDSDSTGQIRVALVGLGGIGKSQIALEFAYRVLDSQQMSVFWVSARTKAAIEQSYQAIARRAKLPGWDDQNANFLLLVQDWLDSPESGRWMLIFDDANDANELSAECIPRSKGLILITSRDKRVSFQFSETTIEVKTLTQIDALQMLQGLLVVQPMKRNTHCEALLDALGYLPLAIAQAATFINLNDISVAEYYRLFMESAENQRELLSERFDDPRRELGSTNAVSETWRISYMTIKARDPAAANLLAFMSMLGPYPIPSYLLRDADLDEVKFHNAVGILIAFSFVSRDSDQFFSMHRLVQISTRAWLGSQGILGKWEKSTIQKLAAAFPDGNFETWSVCGQLLPHADAALSYESRADVDSAHYIMLLWKTGSYLAAQGQYDDATRRVEQSLKGLIHIYGESDLRTLECRILLSELFSRQRRLYDANNIISTTVEIAKKTYGPEHFIALESMGRLAATLIDQGRWNEAKDLELSLLQVRNRVLGDKHPEKLKGMANLSAIYLEEGAVEKAREIEEHVIETRKQILGQEHPDTLRSMAHLSLIYQAEGRLDEARELEELIFKTRQQILGEKHPDTLKSTTNLSVLYKAEGRLDEARELEEYFKAQSA
ncbi:hypothetical protein BP6252_10965 [Coleophoma cylindrospora]|uniref:AAA+ ATPase domain-containing protein n=1 Tax=Coleophoma cylindrospora TaxID=1849047 RepID=A0A3D8QP56_9HELO|nr:hypothetical protein BP6252_10965 [Coleophoma cylindrospora]